jgi:hypothetical protein
MYPSSSLRSWVFNAPVLSFYRRFLVWDHDGEEQQWTAWVELWVCVLQQREHRHSFIRGAYPGEFIVSIFLDNVWRSVRHFA